jgi:hypothetical protein
MAGSARSPRRSGRSPSVQPRRATSTGSIGRVCGAGGSFGTGAQDRRGTIPADVDTTLTPLQRDLVALLEATRRAERDLFGRLTVEQREQPGTIGDWSAKDLLAHLGAWRAIEARRLEARADAAPADPADPALDEPIDDSNARLRDRQADWSWEAVGREADSSIDALIAAIGRSATDVLCECDDGSVAGIGSNGVNHAVGHLPEIASMGGDRARFGAFADEVEATLGAGHLPPRDSGVILYNIACARSLAGELDDARRLLRAAFTRRHDLRELAPNDPDLAALHGELATFA